MRGRNFSSFLPFLLLQNIAYKTGFKSLNSVRLHLAVDHICYSCEINFFFFKYSCEALLREEKQSSILYNQHPLAERISHIRRKCQKTTSSSPKPRLNKVRSIQPKHTPNAPDQNFMLFSSIVKMKSQIQYVEK